jgi:hypothetical protein
MGKLEGQSTPVKNGLGAPGTSTPLTSPSPMDPISTPSPLLLIPHPLFDWGHLTSLCEDPSSPLTPTALQMPLREAQGPMCYDPDGQIQRGRQVFVHRPFTTTDLLNWKHHTPSFMEKPQALINLMQSITQTHKPT